MDSALGETKRSTCIIPSHPGGVFAAAFLVMEGAIGADIFVNALLLNILRNPVSEVYQYKSTLDEQTLNISQEGLRDFVLEWWSLDDAAGVECSQ
jgi:hypothetical protein